MSQRASELVEGEEETIAHPYAIFCEAGELGEPFASRRLGVVAYLEFALEDFNLLATVRGARSSVLASGIGAARSGAGARARACTRAVARAAVRAVGVL